MQENGEILIAKDDTIWRVAVVMLLAGILGAVVAMALLMPQPIEDAPVARSIQTTLAYATGSYTISTSAITVSNSGFGWGATDIANAERAYISAYTAGIAVTWDGTDPTSTQGYPVAANGTLEIEGNGNIRNLRFIRTGGSDAIVSVTLEG